jgi:hypothetical protein
MLHHIPPLAVAARLPQAAAARPEMEKLVKVPLMHLEAVALSCPLKMVTSLPS